MEHNFFISTAHKNMLNSVRIPSNTKPVIDNNKTIGFFEKKKKLTILNNNVPLWVNITCISVKLFIVDKNSLLKEWWASGHVLCYTPTHSLHIIILRRQCLSVRIVPKGLL